MKNQWIVTILLLIIVGGGAFFAGTKYQQGQNMYFYYPRGNTVAWFGVDSGGAGLYCDRGPSYTVARLGVFVCAEGARREKTGGKS